MKKLELPSEDASSPAERLVPYGSYQGYGGGHFIYVRSWRQLTPTLFLIDFTNSKSGKSTSWRTAVVREGVRKDYDSVKGKWVDGTEPTWIPLGEAKRAKIYGEDAFRATVKPDPVEDYEWSWSNQLPARTLEIATDRMIALVLHIHGEKRDEEPVFVSHIS